ncbi:MAG: class III extradiol ring-cleavage dioxygenase [Planctomycetota bacterium]
MTRRPLHRRDFLRFAATAATAACSSEETPMAHPSTTTEAEPTPTARELPMPVLFVSHGAPTLALDAVAGADFARMAQALPRPRAVLVVSAHWLHAPATIGTRRARPLVYDFGGFPDALREVEYAAPAAAALADELGRRLPALARDDERGWDHGVWVPLVHMYPHAHVPVLQLSMPHAWQPRQMFELGRQLAPLRDEEVLVLASGGAVHNLRRLDWDGGTTPPQWATTFEAWLRDRLSRGAVDDLVAFRHEAPDLQLAHPTDDHFVPLLVALGAASARPSPTTFPITGWEYGSLSRLAVRWG